jgi:type VI protein secretion system component VasF
VLSSQVSQKIERVHGGPGELSPHWRPSTTEIGQPRDPWVPRLVAAAISAAALALVLYIGFAISLHSGKSDLVGVTTQLAR